MFRPKSEATVEEAQDSLKEWQFRWLGDSQIHGPYTTHEMKYWKETYFQDRVEVRKIGQDDFTHVYHR
ncbi:CD2 antigen cytoplasmic tail-binding protein 2 [Cyberlindnera fabianii]|uniref:CD2 antigen cytoplasmic tail-binding protein 2 n=1 Tax=Cyberlindnera fabianii TaxID=36022 RepID=A0A1V2KZ68_CYBFA|nr:CD2 antigen cytoplasmic tail-binding protein 2 [Cyberlindnera fabianii]